MTKLRALVTGGLGFIGSHLVDLLISRGLQVTVVDDLSTGRLENANPKATLLKQDILDTEGELFREQHYIFHCAALPKIEPSFAYPVEYERANVGATIDLLTKLRGSKYLKKLVVSSSSAVYGNSTEIPTAETAPISPLSPYGLQKYASEQYALILGQRYHLPTIALRYFNVFGPRSFNPDQNDYSYASVVGLFIHQTLNGQKLTITGDGLQTRDFVHVSDVAQANLLAAESDKSFEVYNVGSGQPLSILKLATLFPQEAVFVPKRESESRDSCADNEKIRRELRWSAQVSLEEGIRRQLTHAAMA